MKKIFKAILSIAALMSLFASCEDKDINLGSRVSLTQTEELAIPAEGAAVFTFGVESDGDWVVVVPSWIKASPRYGSGNGVVTLTFEDNYSMVTDKDGNVSREMNGLRHGTVSVECASGATSFVVCQAGDPNKASDEVLPITIGEFLQKPDGPQQYLITGTVTSIKNTTYGNLYLNDGTGEVYVYGMLDRDGNTKNFMSLGIGVGDLVTVQGSKTTYAGTTIEIVNAQYISHVKSLISLAETSVKVSADGEEFKVGVEYTGEIKVVSNAQWLAFTGFSSDENGNYLTFEAAKNEEAAREATVTVTATSEGKTASAELKVSQAGVAVGGVIFSETFETSQGSFTVDNKVLPTGATSVWNFASGYGMKATAYINGANNDSESWLISPEIDLSGKSSVTLTFEHTGKYFGTPSEEATLQVYDGSAWKAVTIPTYFTNSDWNFVSSGDINLSSFAGKKVKIAFRYTSTTAKAGTWEVKNVVVSSEGGSGGDTGVKKVTVADFIAAAESDSQKYQLTGVIDGTVNETYGNFDLKDDTGSVYVYGLTATELGYGAKNDKSYGSLGLKKGDKITIIGYRGSYNDKIEVMYAYFVSKQ